MTSITQNQRYIPHELNTKYYATVELQLMWHLESIQKAIDTLKC